MSKGIYFLLKDEEIIYIGKSINIENRIKCHSYNYDNIISLDCNKDNLSDMEKYFIEICSPKNNIQHNKSFKYKDSSLAKTNIKLQMAYKNISRMRQLAMLMDISEESLHNRLRGKISMNTYCRIAEALDVPVKEMFK